MISLSSALPLLVRSLVQFTVAVYVLGAQLVGVLFNNHQKISQ